MRTSAPLISVVIPTFNCANTIEVAIRSILKQTYTNLEVIIIDDMSTDCTKETVAEIARFDSRVQYYLLTHNDPHRFNKRGRNINAGYMARNYGIEKSHGELITFQDADDASLLNRIEVQYKLLTKYRATHLCIDWQMFDERLLNKKLNVKQIFSKEQNSMMGPTEITMLSKTTKGLIIPILGGLNKYIPFEWKRLRIINKLFFRSLAPYPGAGNSPLFRREVTEKVRFRPLTERIWPSFMGRGVDRDFNFQVAETYKNSYTFFIPLYLWRQKLQNNRYTNRNNTFN